MRIRVIFIGHEAKDFLAEQKKYREAIVGSDTKVEVVSIKHGPETIEQPLDELLAGPAILEEVVRAEKDGVDAVIVDCALDPSLPALREAVDIPVVGAGQAAFALAITLGDSFSILSPLKSLVSAYHRRIREYGLNFALASVRCLDFEIMDLLSDRASKAFVREGKAAIQEDGAEVIVLGCTGMSPAIPKLQVQFDVPVIDPAATAILTAQMIVNLGITHSKICYPSKNNQ
jgi:allantoin racemase